MKNYIFEKDKPKPVDKQLIENAYKNNFFTGTYKLTEEGEKFIKLYIEGKTYEKIGKIFGFKRQRSGEILKKIEKLIKETN